MTKLITARAHKNKRIAHMVANTGKEYGLLLPLLHTSLVAQPLLLRCVLLAPLLSAPGVRFPERGSKISKHMITELFY